MEVSSHVVGFNNNKGVDFKTEEDFSQVEDRKIDSSMNSKKFHMKGMFVTDVTFLDILSKIVLQIKTLISTQLKRKVSHSRKFGKSKWKPNLKFLSKI